MKPNIKKILKTTACVAAIATLWALPIGWTILNYVTGERIRDDKQMMLNEYAQTEEYKQAYEIDKENHVYNVGSDAYIEKQLKSSSDKDTVNRYEKLETDQANNFVHTEASSLASSIVVIGTMLIGADYVCTKKENKKKEENLQEAVIEQ